MKASNWTAAVLNGVALATGPVAGCGGGGTSAQKTSSGSGGMGEGGEGSGGDRNTGVDVGGSGGSSASNGSGGTRNTQGSGGAGGGGGGSPSSSGGSAGSDMGTAIDVETYCSDIADLYFDWLSNCYGSMPYPESERARFTSIHRERCTRAKSSVEAGRLGFDGARAHACIEAIDKKACDGFRFIDAVEECRALFTPLQDHGEDCYPNATDYFSIVGAPSECREGYCDTEGNTVCPGQCAPLKADGAACATSSECQPESYCNGTECEARVGLDAPCSYGDACVEELVCYYPPEAELGSCKEPSQSGDPCSDSEPCVGGYFCLAGECQSKAETGEECLMDHHCWNDERCIDRDGSGPDGDTCGEPGQEGTPCANYLDCQDDMFCDTSDAEASACKPKLPIGQPCDVYGSCVAGAFCNQETGECQAVGQEGDSCLVFDMPGSNDACADDLACMSDGECHPPRGEPGDPCRTTDESSCNAGLFCSRETFSCEPLAEQGAFCNPYWRSSCEGDLACLCSGDECGELPDANVHDTRHTCQPRRSVGDPCFHDYECPEEAYCLETDGERSCVATYMCF